MTGRDPFGNSLTYDPERDEAAVDTWSQPASHGAVERQTEVVPSVSFCDHGLHYGEFCPDCKTPPDDRAEASVRRVTLTPASAIKPRPVRWLWEGRIALGTLNLVGGREGIGKSMVCYWLAAEITRGRLPGVHKGVPKSVIVAATEDSWEHTIVPRLMAADANLDRVYRVDVTSSDDIDTTLTLPRDIPALQGHIAEVDAAVVLLDPLISRLDSHLDSHKDAEVRRALEPLTKLADETGVAIPGIIHVNKSASGDALSSLMASRAFPAVARSVLYVVVDPENDQVRLLGQPKNNLGRTDLPTLTFTIASAKVAETDEGDVWTGRINWGADTSVSIEDALRASGETPETRTATQDAADWLTDRLSIDPVIPHAVIAAESKAAGHSLPSIKRARSKLGVCSLSHGFPRRTYWSRKGMTPDEVTAWLDEHPEATSSGTKP